MSYVMGQITVASTAGVVPLFTLPPSLCNVTFWNSATGTTGTIYVGSSTTVTATNGLQCHSIPTNFISYVSTGGATFYGTVPSGTAQVNYIIVTDQR